MDRDKIIAVALVVAFVFLLVALLGVVAVTGFLLVFTGKSGGDAGSTGALIDSDGDAALPDSGGDSHTLPDTGSGGNDGTTPPAPVAPVCGNGTKETGEQCETDSQCSTGNVCTACQCVLKAPDKVKLTSVAVSGLAFWCAPDFEGQRGLAIKRIDLKNNGTAAFSEPGKATITAVTGDVTDSVMTKAAFKFLIPAGKTLGIYQTNLARDDAPYIFVGTTPLSKVKLNIDFGADYIEYEYTLKGNDFSAAGCQ